VLDQVREPSSLQDQRRPYRRRRRPEERVEVLGGVMDLVKSSEVFHFTRGMIAAGRKAIVANHNLHSLYLIKRDADLRACFNKADLVEVDSIPLILWARLVGRPSRRFHRCTYLDWRDEFWALAERHSWRVFVVGGEPGVGEAATRRIHREWPGVQLATHHGFFDVSPGSEENAAVVDTIKRYAPDVLLVGMGMPRQERWVMRNYRDLPACVIFTVGGAMDYEAGVQTPSPRWIGQVGLEWLFRMATNPGLFRRYLIEPWSLLAPAAADVARRVLKTKATESRELENDARDRTAFPPTAL
jgi:N-acetylglucosaminyldiphosphoundecaprenol N-acetyl-beta-D-mannosaminyltransferase